MLLTDWLRLLSASRSQMRAHRQSTRKRRNVVCASGIFNRPETLEKRVFLSAANVLLTDIFGSSGFRVIGENPGGDSLGNSIRAAGDVNGDGFEDVILGAYRYGQSVGAAYVLFGKSTGFSSVLDLDFLSPSDGFIIRGSATSDLAGTAVSGGGDINGDGFDDLVILSPVYSETPSVSSGYVVFGKSNITDVNLSSIDNGASDSVGFRLTGFATTSQFNAADSVATGGDINGDGYDDVVFGAPKTTKGEAYGVGAAYVILGKSSGFSNLNISDLTGSNGFIFTDSATGYNASLAYIGSSVSIGGDINGDGFDDLVVGAPKLNKQQYGVTPGYDGEVYVIFGRSSFSSTVEVTSLTGTTGFVAKGVVGQQAETGRSVSSGGDVNGDGIDDFVIGSPGSYDYANVTGRAYVVFGKTNLGSSGTLNLTSLTGSSGFILRGAANYDVAGTSVSITGDINGDGFADIVVGAPSSNSASEVPGATNGKAYVVFGSSNIVVPANLGVLNGVNGFQLSGTGSSYAGRTVAIGGDLNGDGFDDLLIGEPYSSRGTVTFFFGKDFGLNNGNASDGELGNGRQQINGSTNGTLSANQGSAADILVGGVGDDTLNADGGSDVLIGGEGDDVLVAAFSNFSAIPSFDGGTGVDILTGGISFAGQTINLTTIPGNRISNIEVIDLEDSATETLILNLRAVLAITGAGPTSASTSPFATNDAHTLVILRDADDTVSGITAGNGWTQGANQTIDGKTFEVFTQAGATVKIQSANVVDGDVNGDNVFDFNDGILIALVKAFFPDSSIVANQGGTSLTAAAIKANVAELNGESVFDVNDDATFDFNDGILIALVKAFFPDSSIVANQGGTSLTATAIKANVNAIPSPPSGRLAPPARPPEDASKSEPPELPSFLTPPPVPLLVSDESPASEGSRRDDLADVSSDVTLNGDESDEAFTTDQIGVSLNLLL